MLMFLAASVAAAGVVFAWLSEQVVYAYAALAVSVACFLVLARPGLRRALARGRERADGDPEPEASHDDGDDGAPDAVDACPVEPENRDDGPADDDRLVYLIPGRKRFHRRGCSVLDGQASDVVTLVEAEEEGYSQCSRCVAAR